MYAVGATRNHLHRWSWLDVAVRESLPTRRDQARTHLKSHAHLRQFVVRPRANLGSRNGSSEVNGCCACRLHSFVSFVCRQLHARRAERSFLSCPLAVGELTIACRTAVRTHVRRTEDAHVCKAACLAVMYMYVVMYMYSVLHVLSN